MSYLGYAYNAIASQVAPHIRGDDIDFANTLSQPSHLDINVLKSKFARACRCSIEQKNVNLLVTNLTNTNTYNSKHQHKITLDPTIKNHTYTALHNFSQSLSNMLSTIKNELSQASSQSPIDNQRYVISYVLNKSIYPLIWEPDATLIAQIKSDNATDVPLDLIDRNHRANHTCLYVLNKSEYYRLTILIEALAQLNKKYPAKSVTLTPETIETINKNCTSFITQIKTIFTYKIMENAQFITTTTPTAILSSNVHNNNNNNSTQSSPTSSPLCSIEDRSNHSSSQNKEEEENNSDDDDRKEEKEEDPEDSILVEEEKEEEEGKELTPQHTPTSPSPRSSSHSSATLTSPTITTSSSTGLTPAPTQPTSSGSLTDDSKDVTHTGDQQTQVTSGKKKKNKKKGQ